MNLLGSSLSSIKPRLDDSGTDRLSYYYSTMIIMVMSVTITARQYVGSPLQCWVPAQFTGAWEQYAENYCFVYNTYWVQPDSQIPDEIDLRTQAQLIYYQWVPFIMAIEAGFFYLPAVFWGKVSRKAGINIEAIVKMAVEAEESTGEDKRKEHIATICTHLENSLQLQTLRNEGVQSQMRRYSKFGLLEGRYIANMYLVTKCVYLVNLVGQFLMQDQFLGQHNHLWGWDILRDILTGTDWEHSGNFPRIAVCDFQVRVLGNFHRYSIQCVLVLNMFNEKLFLFLYWWFIAIFVLTVFDAVFLALNTNVEARKTAFVRKYIKVSDKEDNEFRFDKFCKQQVNPDMIVLFKMITEHSSEIITSELLHEMWKNYKDKQRHDVMPDGIKTGKEIEASEKTPLTEHS